MNSQSQTVENSSYFEANSPKSIKTKNNNFTK